MRELVHGGDIYSYEGRNMLDFSANINPLGLPEGVKRALVDNLDAYERYPDPLNRELRLALADLHGIGEDKIVCGNGAADLIYRIALRMKPFRAVIPVPTFSEYEAALEFADCYVSHFLLLEKNGFQLDERIFDRITSREDVLFICNPNNPTGVPIPRTRMIDIAIRCREQGVLLVVDECFMDFVGLEEEYTLARQVGFMPNVVVLKAFTKIYAMAGIRLGYAMFGDGELAQGVAETLQPWSVSAVASKCGMAALDETDYVARTKILTSLNRTFLENALKECDMKVYDSAANFILFRHTGGDLVEPFKEHGVLIRSCANFEGLNEQYYRIAVRGEEDNRFFVECLKKIVGQ